MKRKRPARLDIPVSSLTFGVPATPSAAARDVVEAEGDGFAVYCKRGRQEHMEDRYSAADNLRGEHKLVRNFSLFLSDFCGLGVTAYDYRVFLGSGVVESLNFSLWI